MRNRLHQLDLAPERALRDVPLRREQHTFIEERYRRIFEQAPIGIVSSTADGEILDVNQYFATLLGFTSQQMVGQRLSRFAHPDDRSAGPLLQRSEQRFLTTGGDVVWTAVNTSTVLGNDGSVEEIVWLFEDISDRKQQERLNDFGRMAAKVAHEFNNVLMGISPFVEVIRRGKSVETSLEHISRAVKRGKRITEEILSFTRPEQPRRAPIDVATWIEEIALEARSLFPESCSIGTFVRSPGLAIDGDATQLRQIFMNLILNARDAMPRGGKLTIEVLREEPSATLPFGVIENPERFAHCTVRDTGKGMSAETLRHIYEPLFTTKRNAIGLGLAVVREVVQRHGGHIFVESTEGVGAAFHLFLPLAAANESSMDGNPSPIVRNITAA